MKKSGGFCKNLLACSLICDCASSCVWSCMSCFSVTIKGENRHKGGRKRQIERHAGQRQRKINRERKRMYNKHRERFRAAPLPCLSPCIMFRCWVYKYPISPQGQLSPAGPSLPPCSDPPFLFSPPCPAPSYPPLTSLLHCLIRILGLVRASSPGGLLIQKLIPSDVTSQCQGDRC